MHRSLARGDTAAASGHSWTAWKSSTSRRVENRPQWRSRRWPPLARSRPQRHGHGTRCRVNHREPRSRAARHHRTPPSMPLHLPNLARAGGRRPRRRAPRACPPPPPDPRRRPWHAARPTTLRIARAGDPTSGASRVPTARAHGHPILTRAETTRGRPAAAPRGMRLPAGPGRSARRAGGRAHAARAPWRGRAVDARRGAPPMRQPVLKQPSRKREVRRRSSKDPKVVLSSVVQCTLFSLQLFFQGHAARHLPMSAHSQSTLHRRRPVQRRVRPPGRAPAPTPTRPARCRPAAGG